MNLREPRGGKMYIEMHNGLGCTPHFHEDLELVLMLEGSVDAYADERLYPLKAGDLFLTFPHQVHSYDRDSADGRAWLIIVPISMCGSFKNIFYKYLPESNRIFAEHVAPEIRTLLEKIYTVKGPFADSMKKAFWLAIFGLVLQKLPIYLETSGQRELLRHVLDYCVENLSNDLQLEAVSKATGVGKHHISHLFQKTLGMGFHAYVNTLRVNEAARLLRETNIPITEIASLVGFSSIRTVNRVFQDQMGLSPRDYRKSALLSE